MTKPFLLPETVTTDAMLAKKRRLLIVVLVFCMAGAGVLTIVERRDPRKAGRNACRACGINDGEYSDLIGDMRSSSLSEDELSEMFMQTAPFAILGDQSSCEPCARSLAHSARNASE